MKRWFKVIEMILLSIYNVLYSGFRKLSKINWNDFVSFNLFGPSWELVDNLETNPRVFQIIPNEACISMRRVFQITWIFTVIKLDWFKKFKIRIWLIWAKFVIEVNMTRFQRKVSNHGITPKNSYDSKSSEFTDWSWGK